MYIMELVQEWALHKNNDDTPLVISQLAMKITILKR